MSLAQSISDLVDIIALKIKELNKRIDALDSAPDSAFPGDNTSTDMIITREFIQKLEEALSV